MSQSLLKRIGVSGYNKPKRKSWIAPGHPKKSHVVVAKEGNKIKTIRYGEQGAKRTHPKKSHGKPKAGESKKE